jgi:lipopolysaccharide transport system permease protein
MFGAPVVYPASLVPEPYRFAFLANPIAASVECFRAAFLAASPPPAGPLAAALLLALLVLVAGLHVMQRHDSRIRELI